MQFKKPAFLYNAKEYAQFRPSCPINLIEYLVEKCTHQNIVLDCGAGPGQNSTLLTSFFNQVVSMDASFTLLQQAPDETPINRICANAEKLPIKANSVDLICISQALHWFKLNEFYDEVQRIIKADGIIAAWCYNKFRTDDPELNLIVDKLHQLITNPNVLHQSRKYVHEEYKTIPFPFKKITTPNFYMTETVDYDFLINYLETYPGIIELRQNNGNKNIDVLYQELKKLWGHSKQKNKLIWPLYLLVAKVNS